MYPFFFLFSSSSCSSPGRVWTPFKVDTDFPFLVQRPLARRVWGLMQRIEGIYKAASFGNLLIFLYTGR